MLQGVQVIDVTRDTALVMQILRPLHFGTGILQDDPHPGVQERLLAHTVEQRVVIELQNLEDLAVGLEGDADAVILGLPLAGEGTGDLPAGEALGILLSVVAGDDLHPFGQGVRHRRADAVQTPGDLVAAVAELSARVQFRIDDFERGKPGLRVDTARDAAPVVLDRDRAVRIERDAHRVADPRLHLVDRVVDDLVNEVVKPACGGRPDIHSGAFPDRLQPLQYPDVTVLVLFRFEVCLLGCGLEFLHFIGHGRFFLSI